MSGWTALRPWLLAAGVALAAPADEFVYAPERPGSAAITVTKVQASWHKLSPAEGARFEEGLRRLRDLLLARPRLRTLQGAELKGYMRASDQPTPPDQPARGFANLRFLPYVVNGKTGQPFAFPFTTWVIRAGINTPADGLEPFGGAEGGPKVYVEPSPAGSVDGVPIYTVGSGNEMLVFTRSGRVPWVAFTREAYARSYIKQWRDMAAREASVAGMAGDFAARAERALAAMSPAERGQQARHLPAQDESMLALAPPGSAQGTPLVLLDPAWFDPALPRDRIQALSLVFDYSCSLDRERPEATRNPAPLRIWETLHGSPWADLRAVVGR